METLRVNNLRPSRFIVGVVLCCLAAALLTLGPLRADSQSPDELIRLSEEIKKQFPAVKNITPEELNGKLDDYYIIDAREMEEFEVSHIPGAANISPHAVDFSSYKISHDKPLVVYCSVGYRSSRLAERLIRAGYREVYNLKGGIFLWANRGFPLKNESGPTTFIHPYNERWGRYLNEKLHKEL